MLLITHGDISLREFEELDIKNKLEWINNSENNRFLHYDIPLQYDKTLEWFQNKNKFSRLDFVIQYNNIAVGLIGLLNIDKINNKAEFYISMGKTEYKGKGIATQACVALINYAFKECNLHKLYSNTDAENIIAHKLFEKVGFHKEGLFIDDLIHNGEYINRERYGLINKNKGGNE